MSERHHCPTHNLTYDGVQCPWCPGGAPVAPGIARADRRSTELQHALDRAKDAYARGNDREVIRLLLCTLQTIVNEVI